MSFHVRKISDSKPRRDWLKIAARGLIIARPLLGLFAKWKREKRAEEHAERTTMLKRVFAVLFALFIMTVLLGFVAKTVFSMEFSFRSLFFSTVGTDLPVDDDGFTNFLLLGTGDNDHSGVDLTDTMIVVSIDPKKTKSVVMLSIPRDLYVVKSNLGVGRINALYRDYKNYLVSRGTDREQASRQALEALSAMISDKLNIPIHRVVKVNFTGFTEAIDALGGVDVFLEKPLVDTQYPGPNYSYQTFALPAGLQHLDGETALKYVRSRHSTSDFSRSGRQQQVLAAAAEKAQAMKLLTNVSKIRELFGIFEGNTETNMSLGEIVSAAGMGQEIDRTRIISMHLTTNTGEAGSFLYPPPREQFEGASVLLPISDAAYGAWDQLKSFVALLFYQRGIYIVSPKIGILNAGAAPGAAGVLGTELSRYGFDIIDTGNLEQEVSVSFLASRPKPEETHDAFSNSASFISNLLKIAVGAYPPGVDLDDMPDIVIVLGKDYHYQSLQSLLPPEWMESRVISVENKE